MQTFKDLGITSTPNGMIETASFTPADDIPHHVAIRLSGYYNANELRAILQDLDDINNQLAARQQ